MAKIMAIKESVEAALKDQNKPWSRYLTIAESKTGIDRLYLFLGGVVILALYLVLGIGQQLVCNVIGFVYPAYCSLKALETNNKEDDKKWLTYWVVHAVFVVIECFSDLIISLIPVYWLMKCLFYAWLMAPTEYNGSLVLYNRLIRPKFIQYQPNIDQFLSTAKDSAVKAASNALLTEKQD